MRRLMRVSHRGSMGDSVWEGWVFGVLSEATLAAAAGEW